MVTITISITITCYYSIIFDYYHIATIQITVIVTIQLFQLRSGSGCDYSHIVTIRFTVKFTIQLLQLTGWLLSYSST